MSTVRPTHGVATPPARTRRLSSARGYTLLEMVVSMGIMVVVTGSIFQMAGSSQSAFRTQPEISDMQQRLRLAADMLYKDLLMAGGGPYQAPTIGSLGNYFPAVRPARRGLQTADGELTFSADRISIVYVPTTRLQTQLTAAMATSGADLAVSSTEPGCPTGGTCGFANGTNAVIFDPAGVGSGYELFQVTGAATGALKHDSPNAAFTKPYPLGSRVAEIEHHVYYLDTTTNRLMHYDGHQSDMPLVDNVVGLTFAYYADPDPESAPKPMSGVATCVYGAGTPPVPLLKNLSPGSSTLVRLTSADLTDGPWCGVSPNRFDGDLLRVRKVRVTLRVQASSENLRGSGGDFAKGGSSTDGRARVPDYVMNFEVSPRNMNLIR